MRPTRDGSDHNRPLMTDDEVIAEVQRAVRDLRPLLDLQAKRPVDYGMTTVTHLTLGDAPLPNWSALRPR